MKKRHDKHFYKKRKHRLRLSALAVSKFFIAVLAFFLGLVIGTLTDNVFATLLIAFAVATTVYLLSVLHIMEKLKI